MTKKKAAVAITAGAVFVELIACVLWLLPIAGFAIYPFVSGFAVVLSVISLMFAKGSRLIRVINCVVIIVLIISIIADLICVKEFLI